MVWRNKLLMVMILWFSTIYIQLRVNKNTNRDSRDVKKQKQDKAETFLEKSRARTKTLPRAGRRGRARFMFGWKLAGDKRSQQHGKPLKIRLYRTVENKKMKPFKTLNCWGAGKKNYRILSVNFVCFGSVHSCCHLN